MMRAGWIAALAMLATGCGEEPPSPAEQARMDEADIAAVKASQIPPPVPLNPGEIVFADIEKFDMFGAGCNFAAPAGTSPIALLQPKRGFMKIDGDIVAFAPDAGSGDLPLGTKGKYTGGAWSLMLDLASEEGKQSGSETIDYPARLIVRNDHDQIVYQANGTAQCGS